MLWITFNKLEVAKHPGQRILQNAASGISLSLSLSLARSPFIPSAYWFAPPDINLTNSLVVFLLKAPPVPVQAVNTFLCFIFFAAPRLYEIVFVRPLVTQTVRNARMKKRKKRASPLLPSPSPRLGRCFYVPTDTARCRVARPRLIT